MSDARAEDLNLLWDRVVTGEAGYWERGGEIEMMTMLARAGGVTAVPRQRMWSCVQAKIDGAQARNIRDARLVQFAAQVLTIGGLRGRIVRFSFATAVVLVISIAAALALDYGNNTGSPRPPDHSNSLAAPTAIAGSPTVEQDVDNATAVATTNGTPEANVDNTTAAATAVGGAVYPCEGANSIVVATSPPEDVLEVLFLRIRLDPSAEIALPGTVGPVCVESGEVEMKSDGMSTLWRADEPDTFATAFSPATLRATGSTPAWVIAAAIGRDVRRIAIPDGAEIINLGGGWLSPNDQREFAVTVSTVHLDPIRRLSIDTGSGSAVVIAVERGRVEIDSTTTSNTSVARFDRRPLQLSEQLDLQSNDTGASTLPQGYSYFAAEAVISVTGGEAGADFTMLTIDANSALIGAIEYEPGDFAVATPTEVTGSGTPMPECTAPPLSEAEFNAYFGGELTTPTVEAIIAKERFAVGEGAESDDSETKAAIRETLEQLSACAASGDVYSFLGTASLEYLGTFLLDEDSTYESIDDNWSYDGPTDELPKIAIWDIRVQADDRITAKVEIDGDASLITFVRHGERWVIDDIDEGAIIEPAPRDAY